MTINHFAGTQNVVFVPALLLVLLATVALCLPIVLAPGLRRSRRLRPTVIVGAIVAVAAVGFAAQQAAVGFRTLAAERTALRDDLRSGYGLTFSADQVGTLMDGGKIPTAMPELQSRLGLITRTTPYDLQIKATAKDSDVYALTLGEVPIPRA